MPTFLHTADIHLDSAFSAHFDAKRAEIRRSELRRSVSEMVDMAKGLDLLLISGDLFDGKCVSAETVAFLKRKFSEIPDTKIFIVAGNHDAYTPSSVYASEDFGENVHIFGTEVECVELPSLKTRVFGASFADSSCDKTIFVPEIKKIDGITDILVLHGDLVSAQGESNYNPIDKEFLKNCGADYVALGHIHKRSEVERLGETYYAYPGPPEGRGFDECGDMGCYIGSIEDRVAQVRFVRVCRRRMFHINADISEATDSLDAVRIIMDEVFKLGTEDDLYKIIISGRLSREVINTDVLRDELSDKLYYTEIIDKTRSDYDLDYLESQNSLCGEFVRIMKKRLENAGPEQKELAEDAIKLGIEALLGGEK